MSRFAQSGSGRGAARSAGEFNQMTIHPGMVEVVYVTHIADPEHFYVQLTKLSSDLDRLMDKLHEVYEEMEETITQPYLGSPCVAQYSEDNGWYRAVITGILKSGMLEVRFIDYGNAECLSVDKVKDIKPEFLAQPAMGLHCGLNGVATTQGYWAPEHTVQFEDLALDQTFTATFRGFKSEEGILLVELVNGSGKNINKDFGSSTNTVCVEESSPGIQRHVQKGQGDIGLQISLNINSNAGASGQVYSNGDQGSLPCVDLAPGQNEVVVVYAFTPGEFWCQLVKSADKLSALTTQLSQEYSSLNPGELTVSSPRPGMLCAAKFCEDMMWYRGQIKSVGKDEIEVYFVDYGNTEKISPDLVKDLKPALRTEPAQAIKCMLSNLRSSSGSWTDEAAEAFESVTLDKHLQAISDGRLVDGKVPVKLKDEVEGYDVAEKLAKSNHGIVAKSTIPRVPAHLAKQPSFAKIDIPLPSESEVFLSWSENPGLFWVHLKNNQTKLDDLVEKVQEMYTSQATPVRSILPGMAVVAQYTEDEAWYRAIVQKMRGKKVDVLFVDFGNCDTVSADTLKEISSPISDIPMQAVLCSLTAIRPPTTANWTEDAKSVLENITKNGALCRFLSVQSGCYIVKLSVNGKDVESELVSAGVAKSAPREVTFARVSPSVVAKRFPKPQLLSVGQSQKAFISHIDSLDSFWCQLSDMLPQLDSIMEQLEGFYSQGNGIQLPNPQPGMACVAKFSEDLSWYRTVVKSVEKTGIRVHFVDYGNSEVASPTSVCSIGSQFLALPTQAVHCRLAVSPGASDEVIDKFHEFVSEKEVYLKVLAIEDKVSVVDVLESEQSVTKNLKELFPTLQTSSQAQSSGRASAASRLDYVAPNRLTGKTQKVFVSFTESPQMFCVHLAHIDSELDAIKEKLTAIYGSGTHPPLASPRPGQPCCALYAEDGAWYRGRIVAVRGDQVTVKFVDYGNADVVTSENVKPLSADLLSPSPLALECSLENISPVGDTWTDDAVAFFETLTVEKEIACEFKKGKDVTLSIDGVDVAQKMEEKGFLKSSGMVPTDSELSLIYNPPTVPGQPNKAFVTHVEDAGIFYVQLASAEDLVAELSERLQELYNTPAATSSLSSVQNGTACCAKFTEDEAWYRATIENDQGHSVHVRFVDFGNTDLISIGDVKSLDVDFFPIPPLAFQCKLQGLSSWKGEQKQKFTDLTLDKEVTVKFLTKTAPYTVELSLESQNVMKHLMPDLTSPPRSDQPSQRKNSPPQPASTPWHEAANRSFGSPPSSPFGPVPSREESKGPFGSRPSRNDGGGFASGHSKNEGSSFGSRPSRNDGSGFGSSQSRNEGRGFGSRQSRNDGSRFGSGQSRREGSGFGSAPRGGGQRKPGGFTSPNKPGAAPPPILEKIPAEEQIYASQSVPGSEIKSCISHVEKNYIYLQQTKDINNMLAYSNKIKNLPTNEVNPVVGLACGALFTDDNTWYRAKVTRVTSGKVTVVFVDFGNSDTVTPSSLKQLSRELLGIPPFAYQCQLDGVASLTPELTTVLAEEAADKELNVKFLTQEIPYIANMSTQNGKDITQILCPSKFTDQTAPSQILPGVVSNIATDGTFYVQLLKDQDAIKQIEEELKAVYAKGTIDNPKSFENGKACCARYPDDQSWQRGIVQNVGEKFIEVKFVDLGVTESVKSAFVQILPRKFMFTAPYAYECILKDFTSWTEEQRDKFVTMTDGKTMNIQFVSTQAPPFKVEMTRSVGLELLGDKPDVKRVSVSSGSSHAESVEKAVPMAMPEQKLPDGETGYVSFVDSDGSFYLQLSSEEEKLGEITEELQEEYSESGGERVFGLTIGMLCCAKYTEDDAWYRAEVASIKNEQITVRFVDYGNTDIVTLERVAVLTSSNMSVHPLAYLCSLEGVKTWTEMLGGRFDEVTKEKALTVVRKAAAEVPPFQVELMLEDEKNLKDVLADEIAEANEIAGGGFKRTNLAVGQKVDVYVSHVDSTLNFWVQPVSGESDLATVATAISEGYGSGEPQESQEWMKEGAAVVAKYAEDEQWYRGTLQTVGEETCKVQFVDYGNADDVSKTNIYPIKPEHVKLTAQAVSCRLDKLTVMEGKEDAAMDGLFEITNEKSVSLQVVQKVREEKVRYVVSLYSGGVDVRDKLVADGLCCLKAEDKELSPNDEILTKTDVELTEQSPNHKSLTKTEGMVSEQSPNNKILTKDNVMDATPNPFTVIDLQEGQRISVHILHTVTPNQFYIQPESSKHGLDEVMEAMYEFYNDLAEGDMVVDSPEAGQPCACVYGEDGSWHRAKVCSVKDGNCSVFYVDYGNTETVACSSVRQLPEQFMKLPAQSVQCSLAGVRSKDETWSQEALDLFEELTSNKMLIMDILTVERDGSCTVHLLHMGLAINKVLLEKNHGVDAATPIPISHKVKRIFSDTSDITTPQKLTFDVSEELKEEQPDSAPRCVSSTLDVGCQYQVYTSHVLKPDCFYCQLASSVPELQHLMEQLQASYTESSPTLDQQTVGQYGVARFSEDGQYFRARILSIEDSTIDVHLIDYGRTESVSVSDLLILKSEFVQIPYQAFLCRLSEVGPVSKQWTDEGCSRFKNLVEEKELTAKVTSCLDQKIVDVELSSGDTSISEILVNENLAVIKQEDEDVIQKRIELLIDPFPEEDNTDMREKKVTTTRHEDGFEYLAMESEKDYSIEVGQDSILDQFILNLTSVTKLVEGMMKDIGHYIEEEAPENDGEWQPTVGKPCLVKRQSETKWYRGKLVEKEEDVFKVYLVDYREMMQCQRDCIRELPARFLEVPVNGFMCQLADVAPVHGTWSPEAITHFHDFAADSYLGAFLVSQSEEGVHSVRLHDIEDLGGATINRQLVDVGCAMPLPGSLVEMELQMEHASKDTSVLEEMEQSFHDVSYQRENSLGEDSDSSPQDGSGDLCQTFNTTGHSLLDRTTDTTQGPDATLELDHLQLDVLLPEVDLGLDLGACFTALTTTTTTTTTNWRVTQAIPASSDNIVRTSKPRVGETSLDTERDMETPRPDSAGEGAQEVCHDIVNDLVSHTTDISEENGQAVCKNIVDNLVAKTETASDKVEMEADNQKMPEAKLGDWKDGGDGDKKTDTQEENGDSDGAGEQKSGDNDVEEQEDEGKDLDEDEAESDQQKQQEKEQEEFAECVDDVLGESPEAESAAEFGKQESESMVKDELAQSEDVVREGTESDTQEPPGTEDSPECEKDEFYEADDGGATEGGNSRVAVGDNDGQDGSKDEKCDSDTDSGQADQDGAGGRAEADVGEIEESKNSSRGKDVKDTGQTEADSDVKSSQVDSDDEDVQKDSDADKKSEESSHLAEEDH